MTKARTNADNASADIQGVTVSNGLVGGGTSGTVDVGLPSVSGNTGKYLTTDGTSASWGTVDLSGKVDKSTLTTTGDIFYASGASTPARLGIGTTGQVLTVSGGLPAWATASAGGFTLLASGSLSGSGGSVSSISNSYRDLVLIFRDWATSTNPDRPMFGFNFDLSEYYTTFNSWSSDPNQTSYIDSTSWRAPNSNQTNFWMMRVYDYANTTTSKMYNIWYYSREYTNTTYYNGGMMIGGYKPVSAVSRLRWDTQSGASFSQGTYEVYGVK